MSQLPQVVARSFELRQASDRLRRHAGVLTRASIGARAVAALASPRPRVCWIGGGADAAMPMRVPEPRECVCCAEPIDDADPTVTADDGAEVHVRCWRPPDPVRAPLSPFVESPMPPLDTFRSRPGRPARRYPNGPIQKLG